MRRASLALLTYCLLTIALTYPLMFELRSVLPNDAGDPALNTWILWWNAHAIPYTATWWNAPNFYPVSGTLAFSEHLLGISLISTPLQWLGASPQAAYNIVFLLTFPLCAMGACLLAFEVTGRHDAAFIAGLLFGFSPYRIAHMPQIQVLAAFAMPFSLLGVHRYIRNGAPGGLILFGAGWLLQSLSNGYYLLFFGVFVGMWIVWFASPWTRPRTCAAIFLTWLAASVPLAPLLWEYQAIHHTFGFARNFGTVRDFGADIMALLNAASTLRFWGWLRVYRRAEGELFPGLMITLLVIAGAVMLATGDKSRDWRWTMARRVLIVLCLITMAISISAVVVGPWQFRPFGIRVFSVTNPIKPLTGALALAIGLAVTAPGLRRAYSTRSVLGFYALAAFVMWLFSLGPAPSLMGKPFMYRGPYALLMLFPGFNALRVPARFWMMAVLSLSIVGAILFDRLTARIGRARTLAAALVSIGIMADGWVRPFPLVPAPLLSAAERCSTSQASSSGGALIELPLGEPFHDVAAMYRAMSHGRPVVNGYSGYFPPHYASLRFGLDQLDDDVLTQLANHGVTTVVVNEADDRDGVWRRYVAAHQGAKVVCVEGRHTMYSLSAGSPRDRERQQTGTSLPIAAIRPNVNEAAVANMTDGDRATRWESGPQTDRTVMDLDLGAVRSLNSLELALGPYTEDFPRMMAIDLSDDGAVWRHVWQGSSAGLAFAGALTSPMDVPLTYDLGGNSARYVRLRLLANDETYFWSIAELKVLGR
jgi:hypothetical protein